MERNIYKIEKELFITNDEEIKEGDWLIQVNTKKRIKHHSKNGLLLQPQSFDKKIILTTDQDLIKDGIQAIDDEFLEWFVKNPSCEFIETERLEDGQYFDYLEDNSVIEGIYENYKIIIPKEEPKQETLEGNPIHDDIHDKKYSINDFFNMIEEYREKELPNRNVPYHYEAEIDSGLKYLIMFIKEK